MAWQLALVVIMSALVVGTYYLGYWTIGYGFAHRLWWWLLALAGVVLLIVIVACARSRSRFWSAPVYPRWRMAMAFSLACFSLSAGAFLGANDLAPPCALPTEIPVLASSENLAAVQVAATKFEQVEPTLLDQSCYAVDFTVYAARSDGDAEIDLESGWGPGALSADGPRPAIWLPSSTEEVRTVTAEAGSAAPQPRDAGSIASSPLVVAIPNSLISRDNIYGAERRGNWSTVYNMLQRNGIGLSVPNPEQSATGLLGITEIYADLASSQEGQIAASGNFPTDGGMLLCSAAQAAEQGHPSSSAYLVSEATLNQYTRSLLAEGACPTLSSPFPSLTPLAPSDEASLDFPFVSLDWGSDSAAAAQRTRQYELDFYHWLKGPGQSVLQSYGLQPPESALTSPDVPLPAQSQIQHALGLFTTKAPPARILLAIDDSGPMEPYLQQISAAATEVLGTGKATFIGSSDSFGIWAFPGTGSSTYQTLVPFGHGTDSRRDTVSASTSRLSAHAHSAEFDVVTEAARAMFNSSATSAEAKSSVLLLTDGDGYSDGQDPGHNTLVSVENLLHPLGAKQSSVRVFVIAFGSPGCAQAPPGSPQDTLTALATANGGTCVNASDLGQQLGQLVSDLSVGR